MYYASKPYQAHSNSPVWYSDIYCSLQIFNTYKVGIMYCKAGQTTEEEMYNNGKLIF